VRQFFDATNVEVSEMPQAISYLKRGRMIFLERTICYLLFNRLKYKDSSEVPLNMYDFEG